MKVQWKREFQGKKFSFEANFLVSTKVNGSDVNLPVLYLNKEYLNEAIQSVLEEYVLDKIKLKKLREEEVLPIETKVKNHFRNICFRKKFPTIALCVKYIADYYQMSELQVFTIVENEIPSVKKFVDIK